MVMKPSRLQEYAGRAADWRHRAEKLRALARATSEGQARAELLDLALQWDRLAAKVELPPLSRAVH